MSLKIIFLDFDGVLNNQLWFTSDEFKKLGSPQNVEDHDYRQFSPLNVGLLNNLTDSTGAKIVVSSSWRKYRTLEELQKLLKSVGVIGEVIGKTPYLTFNKVDGIEHRSVPRGCEIKAWIESNKGILGEKVSKFKYIILDDDSDMLYWQREKFICVDPYCGLTPNIVYQATHKLNK